MNLLCWLVGHQPPVYATKGWYSPGEQYGTLEDPPYVDGIGRGHSKVWAKCARCDARFMLVRVHVSAPVTIVNSIQPGDAILSQEGQDVVLKTLNQPYHTAQCRTNMLERVQSVLEHVRQDCQYAAVIDIVDEPRGTRQESDCPGFDHEYVDQHTGACEDDYHGQMYFPLDGRYLVVEYAC